MRRAWTIVIVAMSASVAQAQTKESAPKPIGGPWITADDYPPLAIRAKEEGIVIVAVSVDASGQATDCRIETSSGSDALDQASCRGMQRGRFEPARDAKGRAVAGTYSKRLSWRLPEDPVLKLGSTITQGVTWEINAEDRMVSCKLTADDFTGSCSPDLPQKRGVLTSIARLRAISGITGPMRLTFAMGMAVAANDPPLGLPPLAAGDILTDEVVSRFSTDATGRASDCTATVAGIDKPSGDDAERGSPCACGVPLVVMGADGRPVAAEHMIVTRTTVRAISAQN